MFLNIFPILYLSLLAHALLRITLGLILGHLGYRHLHTHKDLKTTFAAIPQVSALLWVLISLELLAAVMLILGAFTQIAALITLTLSLLFLASTRIDTHPTIPQPLFSLLVLAVSLSLLITGAGAFALDLPI